MQKPRKPEFELHFSGSRAAIVDFQRAYIGLLRRMAGRLP